jgi:hypothetical protein
MSTGGDVGGKVETDVVPARQKRWHDRDGALGGQLAEHLPRRRTEDVDECHVHLPVQQTGHPSDQLAHCRDAVGSAGAVGDHQKTHCA